MQARTNQSQSQSNVVKLVWTRYFWGAGALPGFAQRGYLRPDDIEAFSDALAELGVKVSGMMAPVPSQEAVLGDNEAE